MRPNRTIEIFRNVSTPFGSLAISDLSVKILRRFSQGNPCVGGINPRGVAKYSDFGPFECNQKQCMIGGKLLLMTNRKSYISFRLVPKSVTFNDLEWCNSLNLCIFSPKLVAFGTDYVQVVEVTPILSAAEM